MRSLRRNHNQTVKILMSGSSSALLRRRPLRTVRAGFPAYRSSLYRCPLWAPVSLLCN